MKNKKLFLMIVSLVATSLLSYAQKEIYEHKQGNVWIFGYRSGIDFNDQNPKFISSNLQLQNDWCQPVMPEWGYNEASSSICDANGKLLFYSNGEKIWNTLGKILPNGDSLFGNFSSTQGVLILPLPGSNNIFYIFTVDAFQNNLKYGLRYTVIDACLDSGRGDVVSDQKNVFLLNNAEEKLVGVKHSNKKDYWIITHKFWTNEFHAFLLTSNGVRESVVSKIGRVHIDSMALTSTASALGEMKSSPDGKKIISISGNMSNNTYITDLFDFNSSTGILSNYLDLETRKTFNGRNEPYGCSFSPNSSKLYMGSFLDFVNKSKVCVAQYDISKKSFDSIRNSVKWILVKNQDNLETIVSPNSFQLAPNGRIYCSGNGNFLIEINYPNLAGSLCDVYINTQVKFGKTYSMPNMLSSYDYWNGVINCETSSVEEKKVSTISLYPNPITETFMID